MGLKILTLTLTCSQEFHIPLRGLTRLASIVWVVGHTPIHTSVRLLELIPSHLWIHSMTISVYSTTSASSETRPSSRSLPSPGTWPSRRSNSSPRTQRYSSGTWFTDPKSLRCGLSPFLSFPSSYLFSQIIWSKSCSFSKPVHVEASPTPFPSPAPGSGTVLNSPTDG